MENHVYRLSIEYHPEKNDLFLGSDSEILMKFVEKYKPTVITHSPFKMFRSGVTTYIFISSRKLSFENIKEDLEGLSFPFFGDTPFGKMKLKKEHRPKISDEFRNMVEEKSLKTKP